MMDIERYEWYVAFVIVGVMILIGIWYWYRHRYSAIERRVMSDGYRYESKYGFQIWLEDGVSFTVGEMMAFASGLRDANEAGYMNGYGTMGLGEITISVLKGDSVIDGIPVFLLPVGEYAGSQYDRDGFVRASGFAWVEKNIIVIPEQMGNLENVRKIARYEMEHIILYRKDRKRYSETRIHTGPDGGHPILKVSV